MRDIMQINYKYIIDKLRNCGDMSKEIFYSNEKIKYEIKQDGTKFTNIEKIISNFLKKELHFKYPNISFYSEEESEKFNQIINDKTFFVVDPIDGTSSFIEKIPEFTINLSLVSGENLLYSFIYSPIKNIFYYANEEESFKIENNKKIRIKNLSNNLLEKYRVVSTKSKDELKKIKLVLKKNNINSDLTCISSALKFGMLAEGKYDIYIRRANIKLWDALAGFHIANNADLFIMDNKGNNFLEYIIKRKYLNKIAKDHFRIDEFVIQNTDKLKVIF